MISYKIISLDCSHYYNIHEDVYETISFILKESIK